MDSRGGKRRTDPGYGQGQASLGLDDDVLVDEAELTQRLLDVFNAPDYRPPTLPSVAMELLELSRNPNVDFGDIQTLLERDTMLTGRVMKLVRSPIYAGGAQVRSLRDAIVRLGLNTLRDIVLETCMHMRVFRADAFTDTMERLRKHSAFTGHLSRVICRYTAIEGEWAFLCGLLHDVGVAGTLIALAEGARKQPRLDLIAVWPAIDRAHAQAGALMAGLWQLPIDIQLAVGHHHQVRIEGFAHPLAATVCLADELAHGLGLGLVAAEGEAIQGASSLEAACLQSHTSVDRSTPKTLEVARAALGLTDPQLELIRAEAGRLRERLG
jgi:HD-like signal output (HDOD) protein